MTDEHPAAHESARLLADCETRFTRRSGPGGQHRNKVETAVVLTHLPSGIRAEANERRSREQNRRRAVFRLRVNLALGVREEFDGAAGPTARWQGRVSGGRIAASASHDDFPALLAEALDALAAHDNDPKPAAAALGVSTSQLIKFLKLEPRALLQINAIRQERGQRVLR